MRLILVAFFFSIAGSAAPSGPSPKNTISRTSDSVPSLVEFPPLVRAQVPIFKNYLRELGMLRGVLEKIAPATLPAFVESTYHYEGIQGSGMHVGHGDVDMSPSLMLELVVATGEELNDLIGQMEQEKPVDPEMRKLVRIGMNRIYYTFYRAFSIINIALEENFIQRDNLANRIPNFSPDDLKAQRNHLSAAVLLTIPAAVDLLEVLDPGYYRRYSGPLEQLRAPGQQVSFSRLFNFEHWHALENSGFDGESPAGVGFFMDGDTRKRADAGDLDFLIKVSGQTGPHHRSYLAALSLLYLNRIANPHPWEMVTAKKSLTIEGKQMFDAFVRLLTRPDKKLVAVARHGLYRLVFLESTERDQSNLLGLFCAASLIASPLKNEKPIRLPDFLKRPLGRQ